eukprot:236274_1
MFEKKNNNDQGSHHHHVLNLSWHHFWSPLTFLSLLVDHAQMLQLGTLGLTLPHQVGRLADVDGLPELGPHGTVVQVVVLAELLGDVGGGLLGVVEGHGAEDVVGEVVVGDVVHPVVEAVVVTVHGGDGTLEEGEVLVVVVRAAGVLVLEQGDGDEPRVAANPGKAVPLGHVEEAHLLAPVDQTSNGGEETDDGDDDVLTLRLLEHRGEGVEVVGPVLRIPVTSQVGGEVHGEANEHVEDAGDHLQHRDVLVGLGVDEVGHHWGERRVTLQVVGVLVVGPVGDTPAVVGHQQRGVEDEADGVVEGLEGTEVG